ncbi:hypothetical protein DS745_07965 [Anaerobacillus alkaliphilus]|uniref:Uncharacterized protein n=1 Tax=Anaerobacillus alkaliphilus TaxID=1548597 RepID=A0A4Q0VTQ9_9BACI|nr:CBO0543 family protein [Anaerobacillus alkaliphilus]RXJ02020.1 hypothetical protein DS745_07965 [Anaerobacillus alkaliphilus]
MFHSALTLGFLLGVFITRKWHRWKDSFIPFLLFAIFNLYYHYLCHSTDRWLWELSKPIVNEFITETIYTFIIFPCWTILFISFFPPEKKVSYILKWSVASVLIEWVASEMEYFNYTNGWHIGWTFFFYLTMYPVLKIAQTKQIQALLISFIIIIFYLWIFDYFPLILSINLIDK